MTNTNLKRPLFHRAHYNIIAAQFREEFKLPRSSSTGISELQYSAEKNYITTHNTALSLIAVKLAKRFQEDNPNFDPYKFLDACSPDTDIYPLSELWEMRFDA